MNVTTPLSEIKLKVQSARVVARHEAGRYYSCVQSRGAHVYCRDGDNNLFEAESYEWDGTKKDLQNALKHAVEKYGNKSVTFGIEGGFNGADSVHDLHNDAYEPWVSEWSVELFCGVLTAEVSI